MSGPSSGIHQRPRSPEAIPFEALRAVAATVKGVRRSDLARGDRIVVATRNSVYALSLRDDGSFEVSGGWFARDGRGPTSTHVLGCSAGGRALFTELVAAPGLFIEFADGVRTTRIRSVRRIAGGGAGS